MIRAVLFDLDGTLVDSAPDLAGALNRLLEEEGRAPIPFETARHMTSNGARGMLKIGFGIDPDHERFEALKTRYLDLYEQYICHGTLVFDGVLDTLATLEARGIHWGIVTNKHMRFTEPLLRALGHFGNAACVVGGDTAARPKPYPDSLLHAAQCLGVPPGDCLYVGDDIRDIQAARAAGMPVVAAGYGYLGTESDPVLWKADGIIFKPEEVLNFIKP